MPTLTWKLKDPDSCEGCSELAKEFHWPCRFACFLGYKLKQRSQGEYTPDYVDAYKPTDLCPGKIRPMACKKKLGE